VQQRPEDLSGDYEYDLAHEARGPRGTGGNEPHAEHSGPAPTRTQVELDQDMSYDEAHDF
jgi:hypothetical protein